MNRSIYFILAGLAACPAWQVLAQTPPAAPKAPASIIITNAPEGAKAKNGAAPYLSVGLPDVVRMHQAGVEESVLVAFVQSSTVAYHPSAKEVIYLRDLGMSQTVITAMLRRGGELRDRATEMDREERNRAVPVQSPPPQAPPPSSTATPSAGAAAPGAQPTVVYPSDSYPTYSYPTYVASGYGGGYPYYYGYPYYSYPYFSIGFGYGYGYGSGCYPYRYGCNYGYYRPYCGSSYYGHGGHSGIYVSGSYSGHSSAWHPAGASVGVGVGVRAGAAAARTSGFSHPASMASSGFHATARSAGVSHAVAGGGGGMRRR